MTLLGAMALAACTTVGTDPNEAAAIEFPPFASPAVVIGDSLRDINGVAVPVHAIVRNIRGDVISDAAVTYVYADFARDSALVVDPATGFITAVKAATGEARIAARVGNSLQIIRTITVTTRPDSMDRVGQPAITLLRTTFPDTGRVAAQANTSTPLTVVVRHVATDASVTPVNGWLVRFAIVLPANANNDTTAAVFLVDDANRASTVDTTDAQGIAGRRVRVRAISFPTGAAPDSVVVEATASWHGTPLKGAPVRIVLPVTRGTQ